MNNLIYYLAESTVCILLLFAFYKLALSSLTFFQWRRFYWLIGIGLSLVIPVLNIEASFMGKNELILYPLEIAGEFENGLKEEIFPENKATINDKKDAFYWLWGWYLVFTGYVVMVFLLLVKLIAKLFLNMRIGKNGDRKRLKGYTLIESDQVNIPCTFFNKIYFPKGQLFNSPEYDLILEHEKVHVFQRHTLDTIFISLVKVFFWFNPLYKLILKDVKLLHEHIADDYVSKNSQQPINYARLLLKLAIPGSNTVLVNNFSKLQIKERIMMLKKEKTRPLSKTRFLLIIPISIFLIFAFSVEKKSVSKETPMEIEPMLSSNPLLPGLQNFQNVTPSGWPLDNRFNKISSGFGMRMHPIDKVRKMHRGIDFPAPSGTPVYTTGDGVVTMVKNSPDGYGKYIRIKHGDFETVYAQLSSFEVKLGERVVRGQLIGRVGSSGRSTDPHLHYEVIKNGKPVDPEKTFC